MNKEKVTYEAFLKDHMSGSFRNIERTGKGTYERLDHSQNRFIARNQQANKSVAGLGGTLKGLIPIAGAAFAGKALLQYAGNVAMVSAEYEKYDAVLTNTLHTTGAARKVMSDISQFARSTPFQVNELTASYVKLANQGFKPSMNEMRSMGDLASSTGKSFDQLTEAVIDAQTGEFERLKEFGIRAQKQGDKVTFTFKGQKQQVDFTDKAIRKYVLSLGKMSGVSGAMNKISKTTGGLLSNLNDGYESLQKNLGDRMAPATKKVLRESISLVRVMNDLVAIPVSESMEDERREANYLASKLSDSTLKESDRLEILGRLKEIAPDITKGLSDENIETGKLLLNLKKYNDETIKKIALAKREERINKLKEDGQEKLVEAQEYMADIQYRAIGLLDKVKSKNTSFGSFVEAAYMGKYNDRKSSSTLPINEKKILYDSGIYTAKNEVQRELAKLKIITLAAKKAGVYNDLKDNIYGSDAHEYMKLFFQGKKKLGFAASLTTDINRLKKMWGISDDSPAGGEEGAGGSGGGGNGMDFGLGSVRGDNRKVTNLTINIEKQIETVEYHEASSGDTGGVDGFINQLEHALNTVVNDINMIAE